MPSYYIPQVSRNIPSDVDYSNGIIKRYFCRQSNNSRSSIFEIDENNYSKLNNHYIYNVLQINWKISGNTEDKIKEFNLRMLETSDLIFTGIKLKYLHNLSLYYKNIDMNIFTSNDIIKTPINIPGNKNSVYIYLSNTGNELEVFKIHLNDISFLKTTSIDEIKSILKPKSNIMNYNTERKSVISERLKLKKVPISSIFSVSFDRLDRIYLLTENSTIIYVENSLELLFQ